MTTDFTKASHQRFSDKFYRENFAFAREERAAREKRQRDMYLGMANDAVTQGKLAHADALRQVAYGMLPREWASLTRH